MTHLPESIAAVVIAVLAYLLGRDWLAAFRRRNDLADKFQAYERAVEQRILALELLGPRVEDAERLHGNLLAAHEHLVARVGKLADENSKAHSDLATKWIEEIRTVRDQQTAAFTTRAIQNQGRFRP